MNKGKLLMMLAKKFGKGGGGGKIIKLVAILAGAAVAMAVAIYVLLFQIVICVLTLGLKCETETKEDKVMQAISDKEIEELADLIKKHRKEANKSVQADGGLAGADYGLINAASYSGGGGVYGMPMSGPFIEQVKAVVHKVESGGGTDYAVINKADVGGQVAAFTIGKYQMTGSNGAELLYLIRQKNPTFFDQHISPSSDLGKKLKGSLSWDSWVNRSLTNAEVPGVTAVLTSEWGKQAQEEHMNKKISGYIEHVKKQGVTDAKAICYLVDTVHQKGGGGFNVYFKKYIGSGVGLTIDAAHAGAMKDSALAKYSNRRNTVYSMCNSITAGPDDEAETGTVVDKNGTTKENNNDSAATGPEKNPMTEEEKLVATIAGLDLILADGVFPYKSGTYQAYSDTFGAGRTFGGDRQHKGQDIMSPAGAELYAALNGTITHIGWLDAGGYRINIKTDDGQYTLYYAHMLSYSPEIYVNKKVKKGDFLGYAGDTGYGPEGTRGMFDPHLHIAIYKGCLKDECAINAYNYLKFWEKRTQTIPGKDLGKGDGSTLNGKYGDDNEGVDEAEAHIKTLIQIDSYALDGMNLKEKDLIEGGKYYGTVLSDMYKLAHSPYIIFDTGYEKSWSIEDRILSARMVVYQCYLVGVEVKMWFFKGDDPCEDIDKALGLADDKNYIKSTDRGVISREVIDTYQHYKCIDIEVEEEPKDETYGPPAPPSNNPPKGIIGNQPIRMAYGITGLESGNIKLARSKYKEAGTHTELRADCGPNQEEVEDFLEEKPTIKHRDLLEIIMNFEKYSLATTDLGVKDSDGEKIGTIAEDIDGSHRQLVSYYIAELVGLDPDTGIGTSLSGPVSGDISLENALTIPVKGKVNISRGFNIPHYGIDYAMPRGTEVVAAEKGEVVFAGPTESYGTLIVVKHQDQNGRIFYTKYAHVLQSDKNCATCWDGGKYGGSHPKTLAMIYDAVKTIQVKKGDIVERGQLLAYVGSAGQSTGYHLHFELSIPKGDMNVYKQSTLVDPAPYMSK